jgi:hypothetical protein
MTAKAGTEMKTRKEIEELCNVYLFSLFATRCFLSEIFAYGSAPRTLLATCINSMHFFRCKHNMKSFLQMQAQHEILRH